MSTRSRKEHKRYTQHRRAESSDCPFCAIKLGDNQFIRETASFKIIRNIFGYSVWDGQDVNDHLMVVPKEHIDTLSVLPDSAGLEFFKIIADYESQGYNIYARPAGSTMKTVVHQHTHLIKTEGQLKRLLFMIRHPYIRIVR